MAGWSSAKRFNFRVTKNSMGEYAWINKITKEFFDIIILIIFSKQRLQYV